MATSDKTKKLQLLGGFATKKQLEEQYIKTYVLDEGETIEDAPEWAEEVVDPFSESEGGDGSGISREEFDKLSEAKADKTTVPVSADIDKNNLVSFRSSTGEVLFTLQLYSDV